MPQTQQVILPITGMTCANCVATVERTIKKENGVQSTVVNLSSERAMVEYDPELTGLQPLINRIERAGYGVAVGEIDIVIQGLNEQSDANRLEKRLLVRNGVHKTGINLSTETVHVEFIPTIITKGEILETVSSAGFRPAAMGNIDEDVEGWNRKKEADEQKRLLIIGLTFSIPLFSLSMAGDFGLIPMGITHSLWFRLSMLALTIPVQFYVGRQYYIGAYHALRNGTANMDVLVVLGSSTAFFYSLPVTFGFINGHV
ncbi:heavy metal translocating P-type ATPase, partial [bacterium]